MFLRFQLMVHNLRQRRHAKRRAGRKVAFCIKRAHCDAVSRARGQATEMIEIPEPSNSRHIRTIAVDVVISNRYVICRRRPRQAETTARDIAARHIRRRTRRGRVRHERRRHAKCR